MSDLTAPSHMSRLRAHGFEIAMLASIIAISAAFSLSAPMFLSAGNISNVLTQASYLILLSSAQSIVILVRGFDLSLGNQISLVSLTTALTMTVAGSMAVPAGIVAGLLTGCLVGLINGICVARLSINPFIVTLAMMNILLALSSTITGGFPVTGLPPAFSAAFSGLAPFGIPLPVILTAAIVGGLQWLLHRSVFGRALFLVGSNPKAAHVAGINHRSVLVLAYMLCSLMIAIGAILMTARTGSGEPNLGGALTLQTIAAAVIGGMSLRGGEGSMFAPVLGGLFVTILSNGMNLTRIDGYLQDVALGVLIIAILYLDRLRHKREA